MFNVEHKKSKLRVTNKDVLLDTKDGLKRTFESIGKCRFKPGYDEEVDGRITCFECPMRPVCNFEITDEWINRRYMGDNDLLIQVAYKKDISDRVINCLIAVSKVALAFILPAMYILLSIAG